MSGHEADKEPADDEGENEPDKEPREEKDKDEAQAVTFEEKEKVKEPDKEDTNIDEEWNKIMSDFLSVATVTRKKGSQKHRACKSTYSTWTTPTYYHGNRIRTLPRLTFKTSEGKLQFLVDTGAVASFLREDFTGAERFRDHDIPEDFKAANGMPLKLCGSLTLRLRIENETLSHTFVVAGVQINLLGADAALPRACGGSSP